MNENIETMKSRFIELLTETKRPGMDKVLAGLETIGFYNAPASSKFHCDYEGGLLEHSCNVFKQADFLWAAETSLRHDIVSMMPHDSVIIASLLHDVCKADIYKKVEKFRKDKEGRWEKYLTWGVDYSKMPLGHGEKSVIRLLRMGLELTNDEILAIRWHMGAWDLSDYGDSKGCFNAACDKSPLLPLIMAADNLASRISERPADGKGGAE